MSRFVFVIAAVGTVACQAGESAVVERKLEGTVALTTEQTLFVDAVVEVIVEGNPRANEIAYTLEATLTASTAETASRAADMLAIGLEQVLFEAAGVAPLVLFLGLLDLESYEQPGTQHGFRAQGVFEPRNRELRGVEILRIGPETDRRAGVGLANGTDLLELAALLAADEAHVVFLGAAADPDLEVLRQRIHDGDTDS